MMIYDGIMIYDSWWFTWIYMDLWLFNIIYADLCCLIMIDGYWLLIMDADDADDDDDDDADDADDDDADADHRGFETWLNGLPLII